MFKCSCLHFLPSILPTPPIPTSLSPSYPPLALSMCPLYMFLDDTSPFFPHYPGYCLFSLFQCLWLYFACLFVFLIRFHLWVRSYCICLSPPGLAYWNTMWNFLRKLKMELPFDPAITPLGLNPKDPETPIQKNLCAQRS